MPTEKADVFTLAHFGTLNELVKKLDFDNINSIDSYGSGLLHHAITGRKYDIAAYLINRNVDVNIANTDGQTALHLICIYQNIDIATQILLKGADINARDRYGNNPIWTATINCRGKNYAMVELLMKYKPDVLSKNNAGRSSVDFAVRIGDLKLLDIIRS